MQNESTNTPVVLENVIDYEQTLSNHSNGGESDSWIVRSNGDTQPFIVDLDLFTLLESWGLGQYIEHFTGNF